MRKLLLAMSALAAFAAVDMASAAEAPPPADTWNGWYVGLNESGSVGRARDTTNLGGSPVQFSSTSSKLDGVIGGDQVGYNWHSGHWLLGLEADIQGSSERGTATTNIPASCGFGCTPAGTLAPHITL